jgi:predicted  nucleic acid-binding Zn-ribbon protein
LKRLHEPSEFGNERPSKRSHTSLEPDGLKEEINVLKNELRSMKAEIGDMIGDINLIKDEIRDLKTCVAEIGEYLREEVKFNLAELNYQLQQLSS